MHEICTLSHSLLSVGGNAELIKIMIKGLCGQLSYLFAIEIPEQLFREMAISGPQEVPVICTLLNLTELFI